MLLGDLGEGYMVAPCSQAMRARLAHRADSGLTVLTLTHPGRVDWRNPAADPSPMVRRWI